MHNGVDYLSSPPGVMGWSLSDAGYFNAGINLYVSCVLDYLPPSQGLLNELITSC